ncbi:hypothetical protein DSO57_1035754 [Entomophthora muscae]|uniref:Uncharacterized protein n=1 Tax=Entomophthora muscae TaxID=34485 RepID=A0ACC2S1N2_9FUNG|nr:hypothetical protein DSO57_1035754 [Entomophthora muscae]
MTPSITLGPDCLQESVAANESTTTQIFRVIVITLTGLINSMMPTNRPWAILASSNPVVGPSCRAVCQQVLGNPLLDGSLKEGVAISQTPDRSGIDLLPDLTQPGA